VGGRVLGLRVGVADGDPVSRGRLVEDLHRFGREHAEPLHVETFRDGTELLAGFRPHFDLLLLDTVLDGTDGLAAAERIRRLDGSVELVFVTDLPQHAVDGYRVGASGYLLRPLGYQRLAGELRRVLAPGRPRTGQHLVLPVGTDRVRVGLDEVVYVESGRRRAVVHGLGSRYEVTVPLTAFEHRLSASGFFRINLGYLVNLRHVVAVRQSTCVLVDGQELPISRPRRKALAAAVVAHLGSPAHA
jgi:DNA-binding LytR/AlgR family response regulator